MARLLLVLSIFCLGFSLATQDLSSPQTTGIIANKLIDKTIDIGTKDQLLDIAINHKFEFNKEESEKIKKFIVESLSSPYLSDKFKKRLISSIEELKILLSPNDELIQNSFTILSNLSPSNRHAFVCRIYNQGLYDENYHQNLISLLKTQKLSPGAKVLAISSYCIFALPLPARTLRTIREEAKSYDELIQSVQSADDKFSNSEEYQVKYDKLINSLCNLLIQDEEFLFSVNYDLEFIGYHCRNWHSFFNEFRCSIYDEATNGADPVVQLANKRLEVFCNRNKSKKEGDYDTYYKENKAYLKSLLEEPWGGGLISELGYISPEKMYMFSVFLENQLTDVSELAKDVLNKYYKGKPFYSDYKDYRIYLKTYNKN